jgi:hypothetical protein
MNEYSKLDSKEVKELSERIANGEISRACRKTDWFNIRLSSGNRVCGSYSHGSENGEFIRISVTK